MLTQHARTMPCSHTVLYLQDNFTLYIFPLLLYSGPLSSSNIIAPSFFQLLSFQTRLTDFSARCTLNRVVCFTIGTAWSNLLSDLMMEPTQHVFARWTESVATNCIPTLTLHKWWMAAFSLKPSDCRPVLNWKNHSWCPARWGSTGTHLKTFAGSFQDSFCVVVPHVSLQNAQEWMTVRAEETSDNKVKLNRNPH